MATNTATDDNHSSSDRTRAGEALRREYTTQLKASLHALKCDVAASIRLCSRDFGVLGKELVGALQQRQQRELAARHALDHERKRRRKLQHQVADLQGNVRVLCRVRPALRHELEHATAASASGSSSSPAPGDPTNDAPSDSSPKQKLLRVHVASQHELRVCSAVDGATHKSFAFARVLDEESTQDDVFRDVAPLVAAAADGAHACVLAYGQTGAGKTHTMEGSACDAGVYTRAVELLFATLAPQSDCFAFDVTLQLVEVYNEEVYDLLTSSGGPNALATAASGRAPVEIRHGDHGVYLKGVTRVALHSARDALEAIARGAAHRSVCTTPKHERSSRSHCVLMLDVARHSVASGGGASATGRLVLVDLAGSERLAKSEPAASRRREAQCISKSLSALGDVLAALLAKEKHIPFRNSKLTHLLQDSLGAAESHTLVLLHLSPARADVSETVDALKFAARVRGTSRRAERAETSRLNAIIASQASQLQALTDKLTAERELRRKYEKRLEEYRQDDVRRRAREDELKRQHALAPLATGATTLLSPEQQQLAARRWSLYARKDNAALKSANNARGLNGLENIAENILRSRAAQPEDASASASASASTMCEGGTATPVRSKRRLSVYKGDKTPGMAASQLGKRPSAAEVKSILKKRRVELQAVDNTLDSGLAAPKQVSFHFSPRTPSPGAASSQSMGPRSTGQLLRTAPTAARVPTVAATRVRAPVSSFASSPVRRVVAATPARVKAKSNVGWR